MGCWEQWEHRTEGQLLQPPGHWWTGTPAQHCRSVPECHQPARAEQSCSALQDNPLPCFSLAPERSDLWDTQSCFRQCQTPLPPPALALQKSLGACAHSGGSFPPQDPGMRQPGTTWNISRDCSWSDQTGPGSSDSLYNAARMQTCHCRTALPKVFATSSRLCPPPNGALQLVLVEALIY